MQMTGLLGLALLLAGCGSSPESLIEKQISLMNEMADAIEKDAPANDIEKIQEKLEANGKKLEELDLSTDEKAKLADKYKDEMAAAVGRMFKASMGRASKEFGKQLPKIPGFGS